MNKKLITILISSIVILGLLACSKTPDLQFNFPSLNDITESTDTADDGSKEPAQVNQYILPEGSTTTTDAILTTIYQQVNPGVVSIITTTDQGSGSGSGFVYDKQGHIITNYHVVEGAQTVEVDFPSGLKVYGDVLAVDIDSDIAVVKVDVAESELTPLTLGDSDALQVGQMVVAIGNPFRLNNTMTLGIVSAKGRILDSLRVSSTQGSFTAGDLIQTDASINPGNSGGPLLNLNGEVVGINRAIYSTGSINGTESGNIGIGYSISINIVKRVVPYLINEGKYDYPYLGISSSSEEYTLPIWEELGLEQTSGAYLVDVIDGGPADQAGLKAGTQPTSIQGLFGGGDLIIAVNGQPVQVYADLINYIFNNNLPGDQIVLTIIRNGEQKEVTLTLGSRP